MELGTIEEVELIVDQIASNKIPPPNKSQVLVIIRQMMRMAKQVEAQAKEIAELRTWHDANVGKINDLLYERAELKELCDQLGHALESVRYRSLKDKPVDPALEAWMESK